MDNFEELKKKVEDYPNSSLFVRLAEEYKKLGDTEEAVAVLTRGIKHQPNYMSARVALAKIYLAIGKREEAVVQLRKVIEAVPDNVFAHKKLAETYSLLGRKKEAVTQYKALLGLFPEDEDAIAALDSLMNTDACQPDAKKAPAPKKASAPAGKPSPDADRTVMMQAPAMDSPVDEDVESIKMDEIEDFDFVDADSFATGATQDDVMDAGDDGFDEGITVGIDDPDSGFADVDADSSDSVHDMGGLEYEPDGVYSDDDSDDYSERDDEIGLDIGVDVAYGSDEDPESNNALTSAGDDAADTSVEESAGEFAAEIDDSGESDILSAAEEVGREILHEPVGDDDTNSLVIPSGGVKDDYSGEYSTESLIDSSDDEDSNIGVALGLETFDDLEGGASPVAPEDKTTIMREPLAGMEESTQDAEPEEADKTTIMTAPFGDEPIEVAEPADADKTTIMTAPFAEEPSVDAEPEEDKTTIMAAPFAAEPVEATEPADADKTTIMTAPFVAEPEQPSDSGLLAEPGTLADGQGDDNPINDPFSSGGAVSETEAPAFDSTAMDAMPVEAVPVEAEPVTAEPIMEAVPVEAEAVTAEPIMEAVPVEEEAVMAEPIMEAVPVEEEAVTAEPIMEAVPVEAEAVTAEPIMEAVPVEAEAVTAEPIMEAVPIESDPQQLPPESIQQAKRAEEFVAATQYTEAMAIYSALLSAHPENKIIQMKMEELKMLLKMMGHESVSYESKLNTLLTSIHRRKDEFFKSS